MEKNFATSRKVKSLALMQTIFLLFFHAFSICPFASAGIETDEQSLADSPMSSLTNEDVLQYLNRVPQLKRLGEPSNLEEDLREDLLQITANAKATCGSGASDDSIQRLLNRVVSLTADAQITYYNVRDYHTMTPTQGINRIIEILREIADLMDFWCSDCVAIEILSNGYRGILGHARSILEEGPVDPNVLRDFVRIVAEIARTLMLCRGVITEPTIQEGVV